jgi:hypothetical protein
MFLIGVKTIELLEKERETVIRPRSAPETA